MKILRSLYTNNIIELQLSRTSNPGPSTAKLIALSQGVDHFMRYLPGGGGLFSQTQHKQVLHGMGVAYEGSTLKKGELKAS